MTFCSFSLWYSVAVVSWTFFAIEVSWVVALLSYRVENVGVAVPQHHFSFWSVIFRLWRLVSISFILTLVEDCYAISGIFKMDRAILRMSRTTSFIEAFYTPQTILGEDVAVAVVLVANGAFVGRALKAVCHTAFPRVVTGIWIVIFCFKSLQFVDLVRNFTENLLR